MDHTPAPHPAPGLDDATYQRIEASIASDQSPVGIDARKTHVMILATLERIERRLQALEGLAALAAQAPHAIAAITDALDDEVSRAAQRGTDVDLALRNGLTALLYLGQRVSTAELEALGALLRSDLLSPANVQVAVRAARALSAAAGEPAGSVGPLGVIGRMGDPDARRATAFVLEFAKRFGAAMHPPAGGPTGASHG